MADEPISDTGAPTPNGDTAPEPNTETQSNADGNTEAVPTRARRKVYEPTLLPERKHKRVSPLAVISLLVGIIGVLLYLVLYVQNQRRHVMTVNMMAYASDQGSPGVTHIWISKLDGTGQQQLTTGAASDDNPIFSPDGNQIAFLSNRDKGINQVFLMDADGQNLKPLTTNAGAKAHLAFAPKDNRTLGYTAGGTFSTVDTKTGSTDVIMPSPHPHQGTSDAPVATAMVAIPQFVWIPTSDASKHPAAVVQESNSIQSLAILPDLEADPYLTVEGKQDGQRLPSADTLTLAASPDGTYIAAAMINAAGAPANQKASYMILFDTMGHPSSRLLAIPSAVTGPINPVFSPDGANIAYELWQQPDLAHRKQMALGISSIIANSPQKLIYQGSAENPCYTPDGNSILFLALRKDHGHDLYRIDTDGGSTPPTRLSDGTADIHSVSVSSQTPHS